MALREIVPQEWRFFLEDLARERHASLATLEINGVTQARDEPLTGLSTLNGIEIHVGRQGIRIGSPRHVRVEEFMGTTEGVEIEDGTGARIRLHFRATNALPG